MSRRRKNVRNRQIALLAALVLVAAASIGILIYLVTKGRDKGLQTIGSTDATIPARVLEEPQ